jgi:corrinoid protein of di/trimethylamine methyltransferase
METNPLREKIIQAIQEGDDELAEQAANNALEEGLEPTRILEIVARAGDQLGERYELGEIFLPSLFSGADAMTAVVDIVVPIFEQSQTEYKGIIAIGTVEGDVHDLGKRIVKAMLVGAGFKVHDLGIDVPATTFIEKARGLNADIIAASAILTTTAKRLPEIGELLEKEGLKDQIKFMIGGASISRDMLDWAGADEYGETAFQAVVIARKLIEELRS